MDYAERAYFDNDHCHHVARWQEHLRLLARRALDVAAYDAFCACIRN